MASRPGSSASAPTIPPTRAPRRSAACGAGPRRWRARAPGSLGAGAGDPADTIAAETRRVLRGLETMLQMPAGSLADGPVEIDDTFVGEGYGIPTAQSTEAIELTARRGGMFLDHTYTGKAMAGLIAKARAAEFDDRKVLFWHTGGQVGLFA